MSISMSTNGQAASSKNAPIRLHTALSEESFERSRTQMTQVLQVSLDLQTLLELFFVNLQALVSVNGMLYTHKPQACQSLIGSEQLHRVSYTLNNSQREFLGELEFSRSLRFKEKELLAIESLISALICPLKNALLYRDALRLATHDSLTGLGNRSAMQSAMEREIQLANRYQQPLSLVVIDIDHFKHINDQFGHTSGDDVLKEVARNIQAVSRLTDLTFRYGGEEFIVILNKTPEQGATVIAERLRLFIEGLRIESAQQQIKVTVSLGCATLQPGESGTELFDRADKALYQAKRSGRNRVVSATQNTPKEGF